MKTEKDIINALREVHFLERTAELSHKYKRDYSIDVKTARKDKVFAIISKLGYTPSFKYGSFRLAETDDDENEVISFWFERPWVKFAFYYFDKGKIVLGSGPWTALKIKVADSEDYRSGLPAYKNYEDIEEIVTTAVEIYRESKEALFKEKTDNNPAPVPDPNGIYHLNTTIQDIRDVLNHIKFAERTTKIAQIFHFESGAIMPPIDKKKVFAIVEKLGFTPGHEQDFYYIKNQELGPFRFSLQFTLKYALVELIWSVAEEGEHIYGGPCRAINKDLLGENYIKVGLPKFPNYDHLERILANALQILEDFKYELGKLKGISYDRKDVRAIEKHYLETEERDTKPLR